MVDDPDLLAGLLDELQGVHRHGTLLVDQLVQFVEQLGEVSDLESLLEEACLLLLLLRAECELEEVEDVREL